MHEGEIDVKMDGKEGKIRERGHQNLPQCQDRRRKRRRWWGRRVEVSNRRPDLAFFVLLWDWVKREKTWNEVNTRAGEGKEGWRMVILIDSSWIVIEIIIVGLPLLPLSTHLTPFFPFSLFFKFPFSLFFGF